MSYTFLIFALMISGLLLSSPGIANAVDVYDVYVGYADNLRPDAPSAFFPNPWSGSSNVALFVGNATNVDAGAVMITNTGATGLTLSSLSVTMPQAGGMSPFVLWSSSLPFVLPSGMDAIFTQTTQYNFDTSDYAIVPANLLDNCSTGPTASTPTCVNNRPVVTITTGDGTVAFNDTGHVLDTGGFDANCCLPQGNESLNWRLIGTTGVENPNGTVPEPASLLLFGSGLAGLGLWGRKRSNR